MSFVSSAQLAGFEIKGPELSGGNGRVWCAWDSQSSCLVALKLPVPGRDNRRIEREASVLARLSQKTDTQAGIARLVRSGHIGQDDFVATEWISGQTLSSWLGNTAPRSLSQCTSIFSQIAAALQAAHNAGVVHGDLNPRNIMIDENERVKLVDFGSGQSGNEVTITLEGDLSGTPRYLAPELIQGDESSFASDQYAAALILYELLAGQWPFEGSASIANVLHHHLYSPPIAITEINPAIPVGIERAISRALNKDPKRRFHSLRAFGNAVEIPDVPTASTEHVRFKSMSTAAAVLVFIVLGTFVGPSTDGMTSESHSMQEKRSCNLLTESSFESMRLPKNYYVSPDGVARVRIREPGQASNTAVLEVGFKDEFGLYGEIIKVHPGRHYDFSAVIKIVNQVHTASLFIEWLDENYHIIEPMRTVLAIDTGDPGPTRLADALAPQNAAFAVPSVFKDGSSGLLYADDLLFTATDKPCR